MRIFKSAPDGGIDSGVVGFFLIEIKWLFSIVLLKFNTGSREAFHTHAFNALTWWIKGSVIEEYVDGTSKTWVPSIQPKFTPRNCFHRIIAIVPTYAISFRGPWSKYWKESLHGEEYTLTHGRKRVKLL